MEPNKWKVVPCTTDEGNWIVTNGTMRFYFNLPDPATSLADTLNHLESQLSLQPRPLSDEEIDAMWPIESHLFTRRSIPTLYDEIERRNIENKHKRTAAKAIRDYILKPDQAVRYDGLDALKFISNSPVPANEREMVSWIETARSIAANAVREIELPAPPQEGKV